MEADGKEIFPAANDKAATYDAYERDIAMVSFFFEDAEIIEFGREKRMTLIQLISQMGGLMGVCIGFSFVSAVEIFYWFIIRFGRNI